MRTTTYIVMEEMALEAYCCVDVGEDRLRVKLDLFQRRACTGIDLLGTLYNTFQSLQLV